MKDHLMERIEGAKKFQQIQVAVDDYMDYYNNERYVGDLAYLSLNEYYKFVTTGKYPLDISNPPKPPVIERNQRNLGKRKILMQSNLLMINVVKNKERGYNKQGLCRGNST